MKDLLGNVITVGSMIAYPSGSGRQANMHFSKVLKLIGPEGSQYAEVVAMFLDSEYKFKAGRVGRMDAGLRRCIVVWPSLEHGTSDLGEPTGFSPAQMPEGFDGGEDAFNSLLQEPNDDGVLYAEYKQDKQKVYTIRDTGIKARLESESVDGVGSAATGAGQLPVSTMRPIHVVRPPVPLYSIESYKKLY